MIIYYNAWDWTGTWRGFAAGNGYCSSLDGEGFAMYGGEYVQHTYTSGTVQIYRPSLLFKPPGAHTYPTDAGAYYVWDSTTRSWLGGGTAVPAGYVNFSSLSGFDASHNVWLHPAWVELGKFTVNYNINYSGGTAPASQTVYIGEDITLAPAQTRSGYTFKEWNTKSNGTGTSYSGGQTVGTNAEGSTTLYAIWTQNAPNTYTVTYNANGGSGAPASQTKTHGVTLTLSSKKPSRTGHEFQGWGTSAYSTTASYQPGASYTANANLNLFAIWKIKTYAITYDGNGSTSGSTSSQTKTYGVDLVLRTNGFTRTGYDFKGWSTSKGGSVVYSAGGLYTTDAAVKLYAVWQIKTYTITYYANGGTGITASQTKEYGKSITLRSNNFSYTGYDFAGWHTNSAGTGGADYAAGQAYTDNANLSLWAKWTRKTYTVTYNANDGTGAPAAQTKTHGVDLTLTSGQPTRTGYRFLRWNTSSSGNGTNYSPGTVYSANASVTLYAVWEKLTSYSITYNANGGTGAPSATTGYAGETKALSSSKPSKANTSQTFAVTYNKVEADATISKSSDSATVTTSYTFVKWNTAANGSGQDYLPGQSVQMTKNLTLYAIYSQKRTGGVSLPTGSLEQYVLQGFTESQGSSVLVSNPYMPTKNITLYASWTGNGNGGYLKFASQTNLNLHEGDVIRLFGCSDPSNDGVYTVKSYSYSNGTAKMELLEDFPVAASQDAEKDNLMIYGPGTFVPDMDYICSLNNRLWGCSSATRTIYASALGDPTDFWLFEGTALDSFQVGVGTADKFTGCVALNSTVLFFKQHCIHKMMGSFPAEYTLYTYNLEGASESNNQSAQNCDGSALYISEHGINIYSGSDTGKLSKELGEGNMHDSLSMYNGEKYYLSYKDNAGKNHTYVYDIRYGIWCEVDYGEVLSFAHMTDKDYVLSKVDGVSHVLCINSGLKLDGDWYMLFKPFYEVIADTRGSSEILEKKRYTGLSFRVELPKGSWIKATVIPDGGMPIIAVRHAGREINVQNFTIRTPRCDKIQLKLEGHGPMTILAMEREYIVGSRR